MLKEILEAIKIQTETATFLGKACVVREMDSGTNLRVEDADLNKRFAAAGLTEGDVAYWSMFVHSITLEETGEPLFSVDDIPELARGSRRKLAPLVVAVNRVNGLDEKDNEKK